MDLESSFAMLSDVSLWAYLIVFAGGVLTSIGPCNIAMIPLVIAFVSGQKEVSRGRSVALSCAFALGLAITLMLLGVVAALVGGLLGGSSRIWYYLVAAVCIVMGLQWAEVIHLSLPEWGAGQREKITRGGLLGALLLGLISGLAASGCATPALAAILTVVMAEGAVLYGASLLLAYGLGRGVPIVLFGSFAGLIRMMPQLAQWSARLGRVSGFLMIGIGLYFLWLA
jgi:cytochrome c-type biogenesis protein